MLAILWLIVWATVAEAFYDDYSWYTSDDGISNARAFDSQRLVRENFTNSLRSFAESYVPSREGDDELTMAKVKSRLRSLKVFKHTGNPKDFESNKGLLLPLSEGAGKFCTMGRHTKVDCNHCTCVAGQLYMCTGMICAKAQKKSQNSESCQEGRKRKIDSCNHCYCRNGHEICSTKDCKLKHSHKLLRTKNTCEEGNQYWKDCNRCFCTNGEEFCTSKYCNTKLKAKNNPGPNKSSRNRPPSKMIQPHCKKGEMIKRGCTICKCSRNNQWQCSISKACGEKYKYLPAKIFQPHCKNGQTLKKGCKFCKCSRNQWRCSISKACGEKFKYAPSKIIQPHCKNGQTIKKGCKFCLCSRNIWRCSISKACGEKFKYQPSKIIQPHCKNGQTIKKGCKFCKCSRNIWRCSISKACGEKFKYQKFSLETCKEGTIRHIDACNTCYCRLGQEYCETKTCDEEQNLNFDYIKNVENECTEGNYSKVDSCNYCLCLNGTEMCTSKTCPDLNVDERCSDGSMRHVDHCNYCICKDGTYVCTNNTCAERSRNAIRTAVCKEGEGKKQGCNTCGCINNMWICTQKKCLKKKKVADEKKVCKEGEGKKQGCNTCGCINNRWICTVMDCYENDVADEKKICKEGEGKKQGCNTCGCINNMWICTQKKCLKKKKVADEKKVCKEGEGKKQGCNTCGCINNMWICTQKKCLKKKKEPELPDFPESTEDTRKDDIMGKSNTNTKYVPKYKMPRRFRLPPAQCLIVHEQYRIDWCNYCYCNDYYQRVCTDWKCPAHGGKPPPVERKRCIEGARYQRGKCKYCYCNIGSTMICNTRQNCNEPWWYLVRGKTRYEPQTPYVPTQPTTTPVPPTTTTSAPPKLTSSKPKTQNITHPVTQSGINKTETTVPKKHIKRTKKSKYLGKESYMRAMETNECTEGSYYNIDSCDYCSCLNGHKLCTKIPCPVNDFGLVDAAESSVENIENDEDMETSYIDSTFQPGHKGGLRFRPPPDRCLKHEHYRIDWCNYCYCNDYYQRVCSDFKCPSHGGKPPPPERKRCIVGARFQRGKCKYCYCNVGGVMICNQRRNCHEPWWYIVNGTTKYQRQTSYKEPITTNTPKFTVKPKHVNGTKHKNSTKIKSATHKNSTKKIKIKKKSNSTKETTSTIKPITSLYLRNGERECIEGSNYKKDSCNYCSCVNGKEMCTSNSCSDNDFDSDNNMIQLPEDIRNTAEFSFEDTGNDEMKLSDIDTEVMSDEKGGQQLRLAPAICHPDHELYRIDWCNWCYCNDYYQRVCTDFPCDDHGGRPHPSEGNKCMIGARYERGKCKYCYCNVRNTLICKTIKDCDEPWWYLEYGTTKWSPQTLPPNNEQAATNWQLWLPGTTIRSKKLTTQQPTTTMRPNTTENSRFHTSCPNNDEDPDNNMIKLAEEMVNAAEPSSENINNDEDMRPSQIDTPLTFGQKRVLRFKLPPDKCLKVHETYRIDWCNYCYCNEHSQRVCTDWECSDHGKMRV